MNDRVHPDAATRAEPFVLREDRAGVALLTLNRPRQYNALSPAAGCQLTAQCDLAVASDEARFAVSGINLGLFCSTPAVALSRNISRKRAAEMLFTGDFIDAATALEWGLVNRVVPRAAL